MSSKHLPLTDDLADYIARVTLRDTELLARLREETAGDPQAMMQIAPEQGQFMALLIHLIRAKKALEVGVFTGYSSLSVALALPPDGRLYACDVSEKWTSIARRYWQQAGVASKIELRLAPAVETLDHLIASGHAGTFDFAFIDADKENYRNYYERALILVRQGGLIAIDNVLWHARVIDPLFTDASTVAVRELNQFLHTDDRVWLSMLPISDGLTLACKK